MKETCPLNQSTASIYIPWLCGINISLAFSATISMSIQNKSVGPDGCLMHPSLQNRWKCLATLYNLILPYAAKLSIFFFPLALIYPRDIPYLEKYPIVYFHCEWKAINWHVCNAMESLAICAYSANWEQQNSQEQGSACCPRGLSMVC